MGSHGAALLPPGARILTHCNAGALATGGYGSALEVVRAAHAHRSGDPRLGGRDAPAPAGRPPDRLGAGRRRHPAHADRRRRGRPALLPRPGRRGRLRRRSHRPQRRRGQQDRPLHALRPRPRARRAALRRRAPSPSTPSSRAAPASRSRSAHADEVQGFGGLRWASPESPPVANPAFDVTPAANITAIVTEDGVHRAPFERSLPPAAT